MGEKMKKKKNLHNNVTLKTELLNVEDNNDRLKLTFKITADKPLLVNVDDKVFAITENYDIYEIRFDRFPIITLNFNMKNVAMDNNNTPAVEYVIDVDTLGFNDFDEFKQFVIKHPSYIRYLELAYQIFNTRPYLFLLYTARMTYKHDIKISDNEVEITMEKIHIDAIIKEYDIDRKITLKILNKNDRALLAIGNIPLIDFGNIITYSDIVKILKDKPNAMLNTIIMLLSVFLDIGHV
jgi:hypothetical protein